MASHLETVKADLEEMNIMAQRLETALTLGGPNIEAVELAAELKNGAAILMSATTDLVTSLTRSLYAKGNQPNKRLPNGHN